MGHPNVQFSHSYISVTDIKLSTIHAKLIFMFIIIIIWIIFIEVKEKQCTFVITPLCLLLMPSLEILNKLTDFYKTWFRPYWAASCVGNSYLLRVRTVWVAGYFVHKGVWIENILYLWQETSHWTVDTADWKLCGSGLTFWKYKTKCRGQYLVTGQYFNRSNFFHGRTTSVHMTTPCR
jgi:hypothetical protein